MPAPPMLHGLAYRVSGTGSRTIVLIHELGGSLESFDAVAPGLDTAAHVLRYDQRGAGRSETPPRPATLDQHVADLGRLVADLGLPHPLNLVAAAAGALIALGYAGRHPDRVASLVLLAPAVSADDARRAYLEARAEACLEGGMAAIAEATLDRSFPAALRPDIQRFASYRERFIANDPVSYAAANRLLAATDLATVIGALAIPCLVLAGTMDPLRPAEDLRALAARFRDGHFAEVASGHLMAVQAPGAVARHVEDFTTAHSRLAPVALHP
ncbi:alpha/beta fold hydrolase [Phreatobacter stygius]|nr:alpha/beta fold hydrolase [Phreatobacter stygius]